MIHPDELEEEVGQSSKVKDLSRAMSANLTFDPRARNAYNGGNHARQALLSSKIPGHNKDEDCDWDCGDRQTKLNILDIHDDNHELDGEPKKEEEIEFEEGDVDL